MSGQPNIIVTGTPRSGTTLICSLLNKVDNTVALHEPPVAQKVRPRASDAETVAAIARGFYQQRKLIRTERRGQSQSVRGVITDNPIGDTRNEQGLRTRQSKTHLVTIDKPLTPDFTLIFKHPGVFTIVLAELLKHYPCYAIVRNPLATLASWNSVDLPIQRGRLPMLDRLRPAFAAKLNDMPDTLTRQLVLLDWFYSQYHQHLPASAIITYEQIVASGGRALAAIVPAASALDEPLASRNLSTAYGRDTMLRLGEALLKEDGAYWLTYPRASIEALLQEIEALPAAAPIGEPAAR